MEIRLTDEELMILDEFVRDCRVQNPAFDRDAVLRALVLLLKDLQPDISGCSDPEEIAEAILEKAQRTRIGNFDQSS